MLPKQERLGRAEFSKYFAIGKRVSGPYFTWVVTPAPIFKAAVVVSKKVAKKAHERNRLKRRLYHGFSRTQFGSKDRQGVYLLFVKPAAATLSKVALAQEFIAALTRVTNMR